LKGLYPFMAGPRAGHPEGGAEKDWTVARSSRAIRGKGQCSQRDSTSAHHARIMLLAPALN
jgi:hypothetical protein